jgi:hypothetical protein
MDESAHLNKPQVEPTTPEMAQLLKLLEAQTEALRLRQGARRGVRDKSSFRYGGLIAIAIFGFGSLGMLQWFLSQIPKPVHPVANQTLVSTPPPRQ